MLHSAGVARNPVAEVAEGQGVRGKGQGFFVSSTSERVKQAALAQAERRGRPVR